MVARAILALASLALQTGAPSPEELWSGGRREDAVERLRAEVERDPGRIEARELLVRWEVEIHRYAAALEHAEGLGGELDPLRGLALHRLGRFEDCLAFLPLDDAATALRHLDALEALGRFDALDAALPRAAEALGAEHPELLAYEGQRLARAGDHAGAADAFRAAIARDPIHLGAHHGLGRSLARLGRREEALAVLERHRELVPLLDALEFARKSLDLDPTHAPNHAHLADVERALGRIDRAQAGYETAERLAEGDEVVPIALRHARLLEQDRGDVEAALAVLEHAAERVGDVRLLVRIGDVALRAGRVARATAAYERALGMRPGDGEIEERLAAARAE